MNNFFEFGISLGQIEFVQNFDNNLTEVGCVDLLTKLMEKGVFETETKTYGMVIWDEGESIYDVYTRPFVDDWSWDFDHDDTREYKITL